MKIIKKLLSEDGKTTKFLQETADNHVIETSYFNLDEHIICISTQVGCVMGCIFCATNNLNGDSVKFVRNLSSEEIIDQVTNILALISDKDLRSKGILFSFMGMGEPLLNYKNLIQAIKILSGQFPNSRTTVSTTGIKPELIRELADEKIDTVLKIHLSLHAPTASLRKKIMPKIDGLQSALKALDYFSKTRNVSAKVNYVLIENLNDSEENARQLARLLKRFPFSVKLSKLNQFNGLESSGNDKFKTFEKILKAEGIKTCRFASDGPDIKAGCGQLRRHYLRQKP